MPQTIFGIFPFSLFTSGYFPLTFLVISNASEAAMTKQEIRTAVAQMQRKPVAWATPVRQLPNGKWHHQYDAQREWADETACRTDYRFTVEHHKNRGAL